MKTLVIPANAAILLALAACEETGDSASSGASTKTVVLQNAPEYLDCGKVPRELAISDEHVKDLVD